MRETARDTGAPFARYDSRIGWPLEQAAGPSGVLATDDGLLLGRPGAKPIPDAEPLGSMGGRRMPKGLAISPDGRIFLADPANRVILSGLANPPGDRLPEPRLSPLWEARPLPEPAPHDLAPPGHPADPYALVRPVDVALTPGGDLVIVDEGAERVLILAFPTAYIRQVITFDDHAPSAVVIDRNGCAHILLLPVAEEATATIAMFDGDWRRMPDFPRPELVMERPSALAAWPDADCAPSKATGCGCGCGPRPGGEPPLLVVLDRCGLIAVGAQGEIVETAVLPEPLSAPPLAMGPDRSLKYVHPAWPNRKPLQLKGLIVGPEGHLQGTDLGLIALPRRIELPRYGVVTTSALDSGVRAFAWDRIALALTLPTDTRVLVSTLTSDSALEPDRVADARGWSAPLEILPEHTPEILIQSGKGRYLWLRFELFGDGTVTPLIAQVDVFGPRRSSLNDLPALFQQDADSADFLDRFLSYFDTGLAEIAAIGGRIPGLLDPYATDPEFIAWLGSWFDLEFQADLSEATRREMIAEAIPYFKQRGTVTGLRRLLQWHTGLTGDLPQVIEHYRIAAFDSPPFVAGAPLGGTELAHRFTVILPEVAVPDAAKHDRLERLIAASIPAHTGYELRILTPGISVGTQSTVGVDTLLGAAPGAPLGDATLGHTFSTQGPVISGPLPFQANPIRGQSPC